MTRNETLKEYIEHTEILLKEHIDHILDERTREISIKDYIERILDERDRTYDTRFRAAEDAVKLALNNLHGNVSGRQWTIGIIVAIVIGVLSVIITTLEIFFRH